MVEEPSQSRESKDRGRRKGNGRQSCCTNLTATTERSCTPHGNNVALVVVPGTTTCTSVQLLVSSMGVSQIVPVSRSRGEASTGDRRNVRIDRNQAAYDSHQEDSDATHSVYECEPE